MTAQTFRFGPYRFETGCGVLYRNGQPQHLGRKAAILLRVLLEARGNVVTKSDLMDAAWPNLNVEESNLTVQVSALRRCLDDDRKPTAWIETYHRTGYRFAGEFRLDDALPSTDEPAYGDHMKRPTVAVLPLQMAGSATLNPHIVDGFRDSLIAELARLPVDLSSARYGAVRSGAFGATGFVVNGRVQFGRAGIHVAVSITDCRSEPVRKTGHTFKGRYYKLFGLQAEVASRTAALLRAMLTRPAVRGDNRADDMAIRYYDQGCKLLVRSHSDNRIARQHLFRAVEFNPEFAKAHAFLGIGHYTAAIHYGEDVSANRALALAYTRKAVWLDPEDATALGALGFVKLYDGHLAEAEDCLLAALHCNSHDGYGLLNMAELRVMQGRHDEAVALAEQCIGESADAPGWYYWILAFGYYAAGMYREAVEILTRPDIENFPGKRILSASLAQLGHLREAKEEADKFLSVHPEFNISGWAETQPFIAGADRRHFIDGFEKAGLPR